MSFFGLSGQMREARDTIASDPLAQARAAQQARRSQEALDRLDELELRVRILEGLLAQALQIPAERLQALVDAGVREGRSQRALASVASDTVTCTGCGRAVNRTLAACQVCGTARA